jgi:hypothetical protein
MIEAMAEEMAPEIDAVMSQSKKTMKLLMTKVRWLTSYMLWLFESAKTGKVSGLLKC